MKYITISLAILMFITISCKKEIAFNKDEVIGEWQDKTCGFFINIKKVDSNYLYNIRDAESDHYNISDTLKIVQKNSKIFLNLRNSLYEDKRILSALYNPLDTSFVIQEYDKIKNISFKKNRCNNRDTLSILKKFLSTKIKDYALVDWKQGDIDGDTVEDFVVVMYSEIKDTEESINYGEDCFAHKTLLLKTINKYPNFRIVSVNDNMIECNSYCCLEVIKNGFVVITGYGAVQKTKISETFIYQNDTWYLDEIEREDFNCCDEESLNNPEITIKTKKDFGVIKFKNYKTQSK